MMLRFQSVQGAADFGTKILCEPQIDVYEAAILVAAVV